MQLEDLWIGDWVQIIASGKTGKFEGILSNGKAKVKIGKEYLELSADEFTIGTDPSDAQEKKVVFEKEDAFNLKASLAYPRKIDLHLDKLTNYNTRLHGEPLEYQLKTLNEYIEKAISFRVPRVNIVYGKGGNVLKREVISSLETIFYPTIEIKEEEGNCIVWMKY